MSVLIKECVDRLAGRFIATANNGGKLDPKKQAIQYKDLVFCCFNNKKFCTTEGHLELLLWMLLPDVFSVLISTRWATRTILLSKTLSAQAIHQPKSHLLP